MKDFFETLFVLLFMMCLFSLLLPISTCYFNPHINVIDSIRLWHAKLTFYF